MDRVPSYTAQSPGPRDPDVPPKIANLVAEWRGKVLHARDVRWASVFKSMRDYAHWAAWGCDSDWKALKRARVNILGRHIAIKTAQLYAKDPTVKVAPREMIDGTLWDGEAASLAAAEQRIQRAIMMTGVPNPMDVALVQEAQRVLEMRSMRERVSKTLELLIERFLGPDFKAGMKSAVMRALVCGVAWVRYDIVRADDFRGTITPAELRGNGPFTGREMAAMAIATSTVYQKDAEHLDPEGGKIAEMEAALTQAHGPKAPPEERVVWSFPDPTSIIPDPCCSSLVGLEGASWAAQELYLTREQIIAVYGVDVGATGTRYSAYRAGWLRYEAQNGDDGAICVWHVYDRRSGTEMVLADGFSGWIKPPGPPATYRERFWPWEAVVLNNVELPPGEIYPPSDVAAIIEIQDDINNSKQALREHRRAHRPLWVCEAGALSPEEVGNLVNRPAFSVVPLRILGTKTVDAVLQRVPLQPVDPAIYETASYERDVMLVGGTQSTDIGGATGEATATEVAVAQGSRTIEISEERDQLEDAMTRIVTRLAETLLVELSADTVRRLVGQGAAWPELDPFSVRSWIDIKIRAGSTGRPNKDLEVAAFERAAPLLVQIPGINPTWLAEQIIERLVPDADLAEAIASGSPSITAINSIMQGAAKASAPAPDNRPEAQGSEGEQGGDPVATDKNGVPRPKPSQVPTTAVPEQTAGMM